MKNSYHGKSTYSSKLGMPPGTLIHVGKQYKEQASITCFQYNAEKMTETQLSSTADALNLINNRDVTWIKVKGMQDVDTIKEIGDKLGLHPLIMEDILHTDQRPRVEEYDKYLFVVLKIFYHDNQEKSLQSEQLSLLVGDYYVLSFQERDNKIVERIIGRLQNNEGRIRKMNADYLAYALMDVVVDHYFLVCEHFADVLESSEDELLTLYRPDQLQSLYHLKREMISLRKMVWPLRELILRLERENIPQIHKETRPYLRDLYEHTIQIIDLIETSRDILTGIFDLYLSIAGNRMNEVMKVLTIIATIFIPLTFIAGVYGMNFEHMPELGWKIAYPAVLLLMGVVAVIMLLFFRRKKWL